MSNDARQGDGPVSDSLSSKWHTRKPTRPLPSCTARSLMAERSMSVNAARKCTDSHRRITSVETTRRRTIRSAGTRRGAGGSMARRCRFSDPRGIKVKQCRRSCRQFASAAPSSPARLNCWRHPCHHSKCRLTVSPIQDRCIVRKPALSRAFICCSVDLRKKKT
jgi:hypothetical protein